MSEARAKGPSAHHLDHVVINAMYDLGAIAECFAALGFHLTPLGRHSLGSINHLIMTRGAYLELVGVPASGTQRPDVLTSPLGLNGLVLASDDADATFERLTAAGLPANPPQSFSRPVEIDGHTKEARFRTVRVPSEIFPAGRVYFCEHLTPELVWRDEWFDHPNGFGGIDHIAVASLDPAEDARRYATVCGPSAERAGDGGSIHLGDFHIDIREGVTPRFLELGLRFTSLDDIERRATGLSSVHWRRDDNTGATLTLPSLDLRLVCIAKG